MAEKKNGPGKGNRTRGADRKNKRGNPNPDTTALYAASADKAAYKEHYKKIAEQRANLIRYGQDYAATLADNLSAYIIDREQQRRPLTIAGLVRASGMSERTYYKYRDGEADHLLYEYMDLHGIDYDQEGNMITTADGEVVLLVRLGQIIKQAELAVQEQLEENCYTNRGNPAGSIFGLKARYEWRDDPDKVQQTNTLNIQVASLDEAREALKRLNE